MFLKDVGKVRTLTSLATDSLDMVFTCDLREGVVCYLSLATHQNKQINEHTKRHRSQARTGKDKLLARILIKSILYRIQLGHWTIILSQDYKHGSVVVLASL